MYAFPLVFILLTFTSGILRVEWLLDRRRGRHRSRCGGVLILWFREGVPLAAG